MPENLVVGGRTTGADRVLAHRYFEDLFALGLRP